METYLYYIWKTKGLVYFKISCIN